MKFAVLFAALAAASADSAALAQETAPPKEDPAAAMSRPERLLAHARDLQAKEGCGAAAPSYRVIAAFGEGYEIAQYELGDCLLKVTGATDAEAALYREEALFWLRRAAYAGNARAQHRLATALSGAELGGAPEVTPAPEEALGWALIYTDNSDRDLYGLAPIYPEILDHLAASLTEEQRERAEKFAADFDEIKMPLFTPPAMQRGEGERRRKGEFKQRRRR